MKELFSSKESKISKIINKKVALLGILALFGGNLENTNASNADSNSLKQQVVNSTNGLAKQVINDFYYGKPNWKKSTPGYNGVDALVVKYDSQDSVTHKAAQYILTGVFVKNSQGRISSEKYNSLSVEIFDPTNSSGTTFDYQVNPINNGQSWNVLDEVHNSKTSFYGNFYAGQYSNNDFGSPLNEAEFQKMSATADTIFNDAKHKTPIPQITAPFPQIAPPEYIPPPPKN